MVTHIFERLVALNDNRHRIPQDMQENVEEILGYFWTDEIRSYMETHGDETEIAAVQRARQAR